MIINLDKYIDALEGRRERLYCYLFEERTREVVFMNIPVSEKMPFKMLEDGKKYDKRVLSL